VEVVKKEHYAKTAVYARKLDDETEDFRHAKVGTNFKVALMKARTAKGLTQAQLAQQLAVKGSVVTDYEAGKVIPDGNIIQKMNRVLGVTLPKVVKPKKVKE
jgi:putative transcription factor